MTDRPAADPTLDATGIRVVLVGTFSDNGTDLHPDSRRDILNDTLTELGHTTPGTDTVLCHFTETCCGGVALRCVIGPVGSPLTITDLPLDAGERHTIYAYDTGSRMLLRSELDNPVEERQTFYIAELDSAQLQQLSHRALTVNELIAVTTQPTADGDEPQPATNQAAEPDVPAAAEPTITDVLHQDAQAYHTRQQQQLATVRNQFAAAAQPAITSYLERRRQFETCCQTAILTELTTNYGIPTDAAPWILFDNTTITDDGTYTGHALLGPLPIRFTVHTDATVGVVDDGELTVTIYTNLQPTDPATGTDTPLPPGDSLLARLAGIS
jgi:hypothetical protein